MTQSVSVLIVDNDPRNLIALEATLASVDCDLVRATSGREALTCVLAQDFAVIVLDIHMPGMDGFETAMLIRARERSRVTPIMFLTAENRGEQRMQAGYRLGAIDYLFKPFVPYVLSAKVAIFVDLFRQAATLKLRTAELRTVAAELERSEDYFRALIENGSDLILVIEKNDSIRYASPSAERTIGLSPQQITGRRVTELLHPDDMERLQSDITSLSAGAVSLAAGMDDYIRKPVRLKDLEVVIRRWVPLVEPEQVAA